MTNCQFNKEIDELYQYKKNPIGVLRLTGLIV